VKGLNEDATFSTERDLSSERNEMSNEEIVGTVDVVGSIGNSPQIVIEAPLVREDPASNVI
jgi:hypothetical protein